MNYQIKKQNYINYVGNETLTKVHLEAARPGMSWNVNIVVGFPQGHDFQTKNPNLPKNVSKVGKSYICLKASLLLFPQRRMSSDISPSLVNWMTSMMTMRLQVILEHMPITQEQIQAYIVHTKVKDLWLLFGSCRLNVAPFQRCFWCLLHILLLQESNMAGK